MNNVSKVILTVCGMVGCATCIAAVKVYGDIMYNKGRISMGEEIKDVIINGRDELVETFMKEKGDELVKELVKELTEKIEES